MTHSDLFTFYKNLEGSKIRILEDIGEEYIEYEDCTCPHCGDQHSGKEFLTFEGVRSGVYTLHYVYDVGSEEVWGHGLTPDGYTTPAFCMVLKRNKKEYKIYLAHREGEEAERGNSTTPDNLEVVEE